MSLKIPESLSIVLAEYDTALKPLDEYLIGTEITSKVTEVESLPPEFKKGFDAENFALNFQPSNENNSGEWGIYWREAVSWNSDTGKGLFFPDVDQVDRDILDYWNERSTSAKNPVLKARYADLYWEIGIYKNKQNKTKPTDKIPRSICQRAIDSYLESNENNLFQHEFTAWDRFKRALSLAINIGDDSRISAIKLAIFKFAESRIKNDLKWMWPRFDQILWESAKELHLSAEDKQKIIQMLENELEIASDSSDTKLFDPHFATLAADRLQRWYAHLGLLENSKSAILKSAKAFESAAEKANAMLAIAWLQDLIPKYRSVGMFEDVARIEQLIKKRFKEPNNGMATFETSITVTNKEMEEWLQPFISGTAQEAIRQIVIHFILRKEVIKNELHSTAKEAPISALMPLNLMNDHGFTIAIIGSIEDDLQGRLIHQATARISFNHIWLDQCFTRVIKHFELNVESIIKILEKSPLFPSEKVPLLKLGILCWFNKDYVNSIHILVPQIEAACRELLSFLGGSIVKHDRDVQGYKYIGLGEILHNRIFKEKIPEDIVFHLIVLYQDSRGINLRNELAHGLVREEILNVNISNHVVHTLLLLSILIEKK